MKMHWIKSLPLLALLPAAILAQETNPEVVYLVDCDDSGTDYSLMSYYSDWANSRNGQLPDDDARIWVEGLVDWTSGTQQSPVSGTFGDGDVFSVWDLVENVPAGTQIGEGENNYGRFLCYREQDQVLFSVPDRETCTATFSCSHLPHTNVFSYKTSLNANIVNVTNGANPSDALGQFSQDVNGGGCNHNSYPLNDQSGSCSITFSTCLFPDSATSGALGTYLTQIVAPQIPNTQSTYVPAQCSDYICAKIGIGVGGCSCDPTPLTEQIQSWPSSGDITIYVAPESDPSATSIHAEVTFQVSCNAGSNCDNALCNQIAGGLSVAGISNPEAAPLAIFGGLLSIACTECN